MKTSKLFWICAVALGLSAGAGLWWKFGGSSTPKNSREHSSAEILAQVRAFQKPVVLINFWASWCEPCKQELPALKELEGKFAASGLKVILISIDDPEEIDLAIQFLREQNLQFPLFFKGAQPLRFVAEIFPAWSGAVPATVLMDENLKILDAWEGDTTLQEFEEKVRPFIKKGV